MACLDHLGFLIQVTARCQANYCYPVAQRKPRLFLSPKRLGFRDRGVQSRLLLASFKRKKTMTEGVMRVTGKLTAPAGGKKKKPRGRGHRFLSNTRLVSNVERVDKVRLLVVVLICRISPAFSSLGGCVELKQIPYPRTSACPMECLLTIFSAVRLSSWQSMERDDLRSGACCGNFLHACRRNGIPNNG